MTKQLNWHNEWSLGIDPLDRDHRALVERMGDLCLQYCRELANPWPPGAAAGNPLLTAFARPGMQSPGLLADLTDLGERMRSHMRREETFMRSIGYEGLAEHESEHAMLMAEYTEMLRGWKDDGLTVFDETLQESVRRWLLDHILGADRSFAEYYFEICGQEAVRAGAG